MDWDEHKMGRNDASNVWEKCGVKLEGFVDGEGFSADPEEEMVAH
jgi:hypothetical protein